MAEVIPVGHHIRHRWVLQQVPPGTVIREVNNPSRSWTKTGAGMWMDDSGGAYASESFSLRGINEIAAFPGGKESWSPAPKTVAMVKHEYRHGALAAAVAHGVDVEAVAEALVEMGCGPEAELPVGQGVRVVVMDGHHNRLPTGTVAFCGSTARPATLGVFRWDGARWLHIHGERTHPDPTMVVESVNGVIERPAWLDEVGTEEDEDAIAEFKATAWRVGWKLKRRQSWCGTYEEIVRGLGVSQADLRGARYAGFRQGQRITAEEASGLPVGSVLWWQNSENENQFAVFVRSTEARNRARTVRLFASEQVTDHENAKHYMTVAAINREGDDAGIEFECSQFGGSARLFPYFPPGTVFRSGGNGDTLFVKSADNRVTTTSVRRVDTVPGVGQWTYPDSFAGAELTVVRFP